MQGEFEDHIDTAHWLPKGKDGEVQVLTDRRQEMGDVAVIHTDRGGVEYRTRLDIPLSYYLSTGAIDGRQHDAGERLFRLHSLSFAARYRTMRFGHQPRGTDLEVSLRLARDYLAAINAVRGWRERRVVYSVCCYGEFLANLTATSRRTAQRTGMGLLRSALDDLVDHFGL